jgi:DNA processing protein
MADLRVLPGDAAFPARLLPIPSPPAALWVRSNASHVPDWTRPAIAIVGSRAATHDGLAVASALADGLSRAGIVVVSGLARGIDSAAHRATLAASGVTIAVLGSGLNRLYPPEHATLAARIAATGAVVSEYEPEMHPHAGTFPRRNRLVSGLADAVVVVEAPEKSGALITAHAALDQGKDVMVVPGRVPGGRNRGGHLLLRDGATVVETALDILIEMGWEVDPLGRRAGDASSAVEVVEFTVDDVARETGETTAAALARLFNLELTGQIQRIGFGRFVRVKSSVLT